MSTSVRPIVNLVRDLEGVFARYAPFRIQYAPDELICQSGSYAAGVYLVTAGIAQEWYVDRVNKESETPTGLLGVGDLIGSELMLAEDVDLHRTSCRAVSCVSLSFLERSAFEAAMEDHQVLRRFVMARLAERGFDLSRALWRSQLTAEERVCTLLLDSTRFGESVGGVVSLPEEIDLRLLAGLTYLSLRKVKQACEAFPGVKWKERRLTFSPDELARWRLDTASWP